MPCCLISELLYSELFDQSQGFCDSLKFQTPEILFYEQW